jgi:hypothetical protein
MVKVGIVIGTYGTIPYVHLQLESHKRFHPTIPLLVHDDASNQGTELKQLCDQYNVDFMSNPKRLGWHGGDWSVFTDGLKWAKDRNIDILIKISRRLIPLVNITDDLIELINPSFDTYGNLYRGKWLISNIIALNVKYWSNIPLKRLEIITERNLEKYINDLSPWIQIMVWSPPGPLRKDVLDFYRNPRLLWHTTNCSSDYAKYASLWGLSYNYDDLMRSCKSESEIWPLP